MATTPVHSDSEKQKIGLSFTDDGDDHHHHQFAARTRERLRHFLHPDGRRIHIAISPTEAQDLRKRLERVNSQENFEVFLSGTPEHLDALRVAQTHHEDRRNELRDRHQAVYEQFAEVHSELDALAREFNRVTTRGGVSLSAHFDRYGYNAKVRSYDDDDDESVHESGATTPRASISSERSESKEGAPERGFSTTLKLFQKPVLRQYFHKGILWRGSKSEEVQSFELFCDLLYVGIIQINGDAAAGRPDARSLLNFVITFTLSYKIWNDMALIISWFETDDIFQRVSIVFLLSCLFGYTTNVTQAFDTTYATAIAFYMTARLYMAAYLVLVSFLVPTVRGVLGFHVIVCIIATALWIGSIHTPEPAQLALIFLAMAMDIAVQVTYVFLIRTSAFSSRWAAQIGRWFEFTPAINIEHRTERMNAWVTMVFGYTVVAILYQSTVNGVDAFFGKGILGLIQAFVFNWLYFEIDSSNLHVHAIRRHRISAFAWSIAHLPFVMAFVLAGGALARLVVAADTPDANIEHLTEEYQARSTTEIADGIRWFYCAGTGVALLTMGAISMSHVHKDIEGLRFPKRLRLLGRLAVSLVLVLLPLAKSLNSLELVGTVTALVVLVLMIELWATSCRHEKLIGRSHPCGYTGRCSKRKIESLVKEGAEVDVDSLEVDKDKHGGHALGP